MKEFEITGGTITGRLHKKIGKNNQDASLFQVESDCIIGLVSDGCGSGKFSEFGSQLLVQLTRDAIHRYLPFLKCVIRNGLCENGFWNLVRTRVRGGMFQVAERFRGDMKKIISDYFLATIVGFIVTPKKTFVFSIGDGEAYLNEHLIKFGSFANNAPPYLAYSLLKKEDQPFDKRHLHFSIDQEMATVDVKNILIASDGLGDLRRLAEKKLPGKEEKVGPINQWWANDKFFENSDLIRRRLFLINNDGMKIERDGKNITTGLERFVGLLPDDTTMLVLRRRNRGGETDGSSNK